MTYDLVGIYPAQYFFMINRTDGTIRIIHSLQDDSMNLLRYTVFLRKFEQESNYGTSV